jgi:hypothetical protein
MTVFIDQTRNLKMKLKITNKYKIKMEQYTKPSNICIGMNCQKRATFGVPGQKAKFCVEHKLPEMDNVKNKT